MPKKKKSPRKTSPLPRRPGRNPADDQLLPELVHGPARTMINYMDDAETGALLSDWPFSMTSAEGVSGWTSLTQAAAKAKASVKETAMSMVSLEDAGFLTWDASRATYIMTTPNGAADAS